MEADHLEIVRPAGEALAAGLMEAVLGSQLALLSAEQFRRGSERLMHANAAMGGQLQLVTDIHLYATIGWLA